MSLEEYWRPKKIRIHKKNNETINIPIPNELGSFKGINEEGQVSIKEYTKWIKVNHNLTVGYSGTQDGIVVFNEL